MYKFLTMIGDVNFFDHGGTFIFKNDDDFVAVRVDNFFEEYGSYGRTLLKEGANEQSVSTREYYICPSDIELRKKDLERYADLDPDTSTKCDYVHALTSYGFDFENERYDDRVELASWLIEFDKDSKELREMLAEWLDSEEEIGWKRYTVEVEIEAYNEEHAIALMEDLGVCSSMINNVVKDS